MSPDGAIKGAHLVLQGPLQLHHGPADLPIGRAKLNHTVFAHGFRALSYRYEVVLPRFLQYLYFEFLVAFTYSYRKLAIHHILTAQKSSDPTSSRYTPPPRMASLGNTKDGGWEDANLLHRFHVPRLINARTHLPVGHVFHEIGLLFEKLGSEEVAPGRGRHTRPVKRRTIQRAQGRGGGGAIPGGGGGAVWRGERCRGKWTLTVRQPRPGGKA